MKRRTQLRSGQRGLSIIELMIGLTIGLFITAGLSAVFVNSSQAHREFHRTAQQIESGRYAMDVLTHELHHAGYYGAYYKVPAATLPVPDPCALSDAGGALTKSLPFAVQGFDAPDYVSRPDLAATSCATWLPSTNLQPGSDVLVVRRSETVPIALGSVPKSNEVYLQANPSDAALQFGAGGAITGSSTANGGAAVIFKRNGVTAAEIRKLRVDVYFVAPCSVPAGGGTLCTGAADDDGNPIPTLKRLELAAVSGAMSMNVAVIAEGIEALQIDYGIDDSPAAVNALTGLTGDGSPDRYARAPVGLEFVSVVSASVHVLARNAQATPGYTDTKTYDLGSAGLLGPRGDAYKRHAYAGVVRIVNPGSRREIPQ
jgi:type IV pilus assembly protein PilW